MLGLTNGSYAEIDEFAGGHWIQSAQDGVADGRGQGGTDFPIQSGRVYAAYLDTGTL